MRIAQRLTSLLFKRKAHFPPSSPRPQLPEGCVRFLQAIPKAEIHLHFEGAVFGPTILALARKYKSPEIRTLSDAEWRLFFTDAQMFFENFLSLSSLFREPEDFYIAAFDLGRRLAQENIQYVEITIAPHKFMRAGVPYPDLMEAVNRGLRDAPGADRREHRFIIDIVRDLGPALGMDMMREVERHPIAEAAGVGLGGGENYPAEDSAEVFAFAESIGLRKTAHAGEGRGPQSIWSALQSLGVERIDHGVRAREDEKLLDYLAENQIPLNQCPTSNVMLGVAPGLKEHPFRFYWERGIPLTVGSDDPAFFKVSLTGELEKLIAFQHFTLDEIPALIENALRASFLDDGAKAKWITRFREETNALLAARRSSGESEAARSGD
ncbi:MAG: adenosine deaminase [Candidatus Omnitrophica bacterium]|nr:adenosine deaminase [Candidatus Omnitrophota bacterium]